MEADYQHSSRVRTIRGLLGLFAFAQSIIASAQSEIVELREFAVEETQGAHLDTLNPTDRTVDGAFFDDLSPLEIPRSVLQLSPKAMTLFQIDDFGDLERVGAGTERYNFYGVAGAPVIRGWHGSTYYNGMLRAFQRNEMPTSFGSLEAIDLVKGPVPAHLITSHVGGFANMIPKAPYFDAARGSLQVEIGSFDHYNLQVDYGAPFLLIESMPAAFRISLTGQDAGSYYKSVENDFVSAYGALKVRLNDRLRLFTGAEFFDFQSNENVGWNRPTQRLIDDGQYVVGEPLSLVRSSTGGIADRNLIGDFTPVPSAQRSFFRALVVPSDVVEAALAAGTLTSAQRDRLLDMSDAATRSEVYAGLPDDVVQTESGYVYTPDYFLSGGTVFTAPIKGETVLSDDSDFANSRSFLWFADLEGQPSSGFSWKHQVLFEWLETDKSSSYGYAFQSEQQVLDNRLTFSHRWLGDGVSGRLNYGLQLRYAEALQLQDFWTEPFARRDLLNPDSPNARILTGRDLSPSTGISYWRGGFGAGGPGGHAVRSENLQSGAFILGQLDLGERWSLLGGLRAERADYRAWAPAEAGYAPEQENAIEGDTSYYNWSLQPTWRITDEVTLFAAYQEGTSFHPTQAGAVLGEENFGAASLQELGAKGSFLDGHLFASFALYQWEQESFSDRSAISRPFAAEGWELEAVWQPTEAWTVIGSYGDRSIRKLNALGFRTVPFAAADPTGADNDEIGVALQAGQLFSSISSAANAAYPDPGEMARPAANSNLVQGGAPERSAKLMVVYENPAGWGLSGGPIWRSGYWHNYDRTLWIDEVVLWNAQLFFTRDRWTMRLNLENLTDERYFLGVEPEFGANTVLTQGPSRDLRLTISCGF